MIFIREIQQQTNGIMIRRWLMHCNHPLTDYTSLIGDEFKQMQIALENLLKYKDDEQVGFSEQAS